MKIVIDISEEMYKDIQSLDWKNGERWFSEEWKAIHNGIPLPKGHGRIGDLDALRKEISSWGMNDYEPLDFIDEIDRADVIIEADKESEEKEW